MKKVLAGLAVISASVWGMNPFSPNEGFGRRSHENSARISNQNGEASTSRPANAPNFMPSERIVAIINNLDQQLLQLLSVEDFFYQNQGQYPQAAVLAQQLSDQIAQRFHARNAWSQRLLQTQRIELESFVRHLWFQRSLRTQQMMRISMQNQQIPPQQTSAQNWQIPPQQTSARNRQIPAQQTSARNQPVRKEHIFAGGIFPNLEKLELTDSDLLKLPVDRLELPNLTTLSIVCKESNNYNRLKALLLKVSKTLRNFFGSFGGNSMPFDGILACSNLTNLEIKNSSLRDQITNIGNLTNLTELSLHYNRLKALPESIWNLTNLTKLNLSNNNLEALPESIGNLTNLTELNLGDNELRTLPESIGNLTNLTELYLFDNKLKTLPKSIGKLTNLTKLNLSRNKLKTLPESIGNLTNLTELTLVDNELKTLPKSIGNLTNLTELNLGDNELRTLPKSIGNLTNLTELYLFDNKLRTLPESIGNLTNLTELGLSNNKLKTLPESIGNLTNLTKLDLNPDRLKTLPDSIVNLAHCIPEVWYASIRCGALNVIKGLVHRVDKRQINHGFLDAVYYSRNKEMIEFLLNSGADASFGLALVYAVANGGEDIVELLLSRGAIPTLELVGMSMNRDNPRITKSLISYSADVNGFYRGLTPLMWAAVRGYPRVMSLMLDRSYQLSVVQLLSAYKNQIQMRDSDIDKISRRAVQMPTKVNALDKNKRTALVHAITSNKISDNKVRNNVAKILLDHGANPHAKYKRNGIIMYALEHGYKDIVKSLIDKGVSVRQVKASINRRNQDEDAKEKLLKILDEVTSDDSKNVSRKRKSSSTTQSRKRRRTDSNTSSAGQTDLNAASTSLGNTQNGVI